MKGRKIVVAGTHYQFQAYCRENGLNPLKDAIEATSYSLRGLQFTSADDVVCTGSWYANRHIFAIIRTLRTLEATRQPAV